jgi:dTMP kinase
VRIIAFEGIDASGKETQVTMLTQALAIRGYKVAMVAFPRYNRSTGQWIKSVLKGDVNLSKEALHMLMQVDVQDYQKDIEVLEQCGIDFLVCDRYTLSNHAYCMAKGIDVEWVKGLQDKIRKPDMTVVLDISAETSMKRKAVRDDMHELDTDLLNRARMAYNVLADIYRRIDKDDELIYVVDANRDPDAVHEEVFDLVSLGFFKTVYDTNGNMSRELV